MRTVVTRRGALGAGAGVAGLAAAGLAAEALGANGFDAGRREEGEPTGRRATGELQLRPPKATPIQRFEIGQPDKRRFGALEFRSGLALASDYSSFGGLSGLAMLEGGARMLAVSDAGDWFSARVERREGLLSGLSDLRTAPMIGPKGELMRERRRYDAEGVTIAPDGFAYVSYERVHEVWRYDVLRQGLMTRAAPTPVPADVKTLSSNKSLEAIAAPPAGHALDGLLVIIAERPPRAFPQAAHATPAWAIPTQPGGRGFAFSVARIDDYDVSDCAFLPSGALLVLERRFRWLDGVRSRLRRVEAQAIRPGARVEGELIFSADMSHEIDNLEGLGVWTQPDGAVILTMVSDDNFNWFQRNLMLEFRYLG
jgi:hypothetical protein